MSAHHVAASAEQRVSANYRL